MEQSQHTAHGLMSPTTLSGSQTSEEGSLRMQEIGLFWCQSHQQRQLKREQARLTSSLDKSGTWQASRKHSECIINAKI